MVTGSHNPPNYNGFKMMLGTRPFFGSDIKEMAKTAATGDYRSGLGKVIKTDVFAKYIDRLLLNINLEKNYLSFGIVGMDPQAPLLKHYVSAYQENIKFFFQKLMAISLIIIQIQRLRRTSRH